MILAGGEGSRLFPLTKERAKPAVPFGGKYRLVDFVLSQSGQFRYPLGVCSHPVQVSIADGTSA